MSTACNELGLDVLRNHVQAYVVNAEEKPVWTPRDVYLLCHAVVMIADTDTLRGEFEEYRDYMSRHYTGELK